MKSKDYSSFSGYFLNIVNTEYGEIGDFLLEDNQLGFSVYRAFYEDPIKVIYVENRFKLILIDKFDDPVFALAYKIVEL